MHTYRHSELYRLWCTCQHVTFSACMYVCVYVCMYVRLLTLCNRYSLVSCWTLLFSMHVCMFFFCSLSYVLNKILIYKKCMYVCTYVCMYVFFVYSASSSLWSFFFILFLFLLLLFFLLPVPLFFSSSFLSNSTNLIHWLCQTNIFYSFCLNCPYV